MIKYNNNSQVEKLFLKKLKKPYRFLPFEKINLIQVEDFENLGKLTALRLIEWLALNSEGLICLPTGKSPLSFINWTSYFLKNWNKKEVKQELEKYKINTNKKPQISNYNFVQMDEYFPISKNDPKSFYHFVNKFYIKEIGFNSKKALILDIEKIKELKNKNLNSIFPNQKVDLTLRFRSPKTTLEQIQKDTIKIIDQFAMEYEEEIQMRGGLGFVLGGIGPDGHIAFNIKGSNHFSTTRLLNLNYESAAAAASTFGGMEFARDKAAITIGLNTFVQNPATTAIIIASGFGKAQVVKDATENSPNVNYPATVLQKLESSCFYITKDSSLLLTKRNKTIKKPIQTLKKEFLVKTERGLKNFDNTTFLHTSPHHDDIMLGYYPLLNKFSKNESIKNNIAIMTNGSNSVSNKYFFKKINNLKEYLNLYSEQINLNNLQPNNEYLFEYLESVATQNLLKQKEILNLIFLKNLKNIFKIKTKEKLIEIINNLNTSLDKYPEEIRQLKGTIREWEENILWGKLGFDSETVSHMNLGFYNSKDKEIKWERDAKPIFELLKKIKPNIVAVALDPKGIGPSTHYKVLETVKLAVKEYSKTNNKIKIWGYRNVWTKFDANDANIFIPVNLNEISAFNNAFLSSYLSQKEAEFPSPEYDGPFCYLSQKIMVEQYLKLKEVLGENFFYKNKNLQIKSAKAFIFIKEMGIKEFLGY